MGPKQGQAPSKLPKVAGAIPPKAAAAPSKAATAPKQLDKLPKLSSPEKTPPTTDQAAVAAAAAAEETAKAAADAEIAAAAKAAEEAAAAAAEAEALRLRGNGNVKLIYEMYSEQFEIADGQIASAVIDDTYCLSDVMPGCVIHLSKHDARARRAIEDDESSPADDLFIREEPRGTFVGLEKDCSYYVVIEQQAEQLKRDQLLMARRAKTMDGYSDSSKPLTRDDGRVLESCSCIYGNACVDEYGCKDWDNRFAVAGKNGWKGF